MTDVRRERIAFISLEHSGRNSVGQNVIVLARGIRSIRVSAEERICLERVYTVRRSEKQAGDESEKL